MFAFIGCLFLLIQFDAGFVWWLMFGVATLLALVTT